MNRKLARLREFRHGMDIEKYLTTELRQNLIDLNNSLRKSYGTYSPTPTELVNITTISLEEPLTYYVSGPFVNVYGYFTIDPTSTSTATSFNILPPIYKKAFVTGYEVIGFTNSNDGAVYDRNGIVKGVANSTFLQVKFLTGAAAASQKQMLSFQYKIL